MINPLILTGLLMSTSAAFGGLDGDYERASRYAAKAYVKQSHLDQQFRVWEQKTFSDGLRKTTGHIFTFGRIIIERRIEFEVRF